MENEVTKPAKEKGTVSKWIESKGYGFITPQGCNPHEKDIFLHFTEKPAGLKEGSKVEYEIGTSDHNDKDVVAVKVTIIE